METKRYREHLLSSQDEYEQVIDEYAQRHGGIDLEEILVLLGVPILRRTIQAVELFTVGKINFYEFKNLLTWR